MKTYRVRLYAKGCSLSYSTYYAKGNNEKEALDKAIIQLESIDAQVFSSVHSISLY